MTNLPEPIRSAINNALHKSQQDGAVFDVYGAAIEICEAFPDAQVPIDDLVDAMIGNLSGIQAVEISPPALMIELSFLIDDEDEILSSRLIKEGASYAELFQPHEIEYFARLAGEAARSTGVVDETTRSIAALRVLTLAAKGESDSQKLSEAAQSCFTDGGSHGSYWKKTVEA